MKKWETSVIMAIIIADADGSFNKILYGDL